MSFFTSSHGTSTLISTRMGLSSWTDDCMAVGSPGRAARLRGSADVTPRSSYVKSPGLRRFVLDRGGVRLAVDATVAGVLAEPALGVVAGVRADPLGAARDRRAVFGRPRALALEVTRRL